MQSIATSDHHLNSIDGNYFYYVVIMDFTSDDNNNGDSDAECYDVGDISDIRINKSFLQARSSNSVIVHAKDNNRYHHEYNFCADILPMKRNALVSQTVDKLFFSISRVTLVSSHTRVRGQKQALFWPKASC